MSAALCGKLKSAGWREKNDTLDCRQFMTGGLSRMFPSNGRASFSNQTRQTPPLSGGSKMQLTDATGALIFESRALD